jgi:poly(ADP-ribose) glycohydrolase ARH3
LEIDINNYITKWRGRMKDLKSKFIGSLIGTGIGDSLGAGIEGFSGHREVREIGPRYTDDTAMMIGVAESLIENKGFDGEHMAKKFIENYYTEPWRGYGFGPPRIFDLIRSGVSWEEAAKKIYPGGSFGNGSAMRIAPVGIFCYDDPVQLKEMAYGSSRITHCHRLGMEGAALQARAVALAVREDPLFLEKLIDFTEVGLYKRKLKSVKRLWSRKEEREEIVRELGNGIEGFNSVPAAIFSFSANKSFEEALVYAVSLGGDTDTIGAMTGAIAGAYWGMEGIPGRWKNKLENKKYIGELAGKLWQIKTERED